MSVTFMLLIIGFVLGLLFPRSMEEVRYFLNTRLRRKKNESIRLPEE